MRLSIIVPLLNELQQLPSLLAHLAHWQQQGCEVLLVDGGSSDGSITLIERAGFTVLHAPRGRAWQMNVGAAAAGGEVLLFLHADTRLPAAATALIRAALSSGQHVWGRFDVQLTGRAWLLRVIARLINWRSRLTGIASGDQALFIRQSVFHSCGGFPEQPLMEDIELSRRLKKISAPLCLRAQVITSGRRWETRGVVRTIILMWQLRFAYFCGVAPERLAKMYR